MCLILPFFLYFFFQDAPADPENLAFYQECRDIMYDCMSERRMLLTDVVLDEMISFGSLPADYTVSA